MKNVLLHPKPLVEPSDSASALPAEFNAPHRARVVVADQMDLIVECQNGARFGCDVVERVLASPLVPDDEVLILVSSDSGGRALVVGRVLPYAQVVAAKSISLQSEQAIAMCCGESSIELRADGTVLIRGEDVLVRAKRTKRIRAGTVSIN